MKNLFFIGGPMGVGKSAVSRELQRVLPDCALLDGDNLWDMRPFVVNEDTKACVLANIIACLNNFLACPQFKNIIFCWVMHEQSIIDGIVSQLDLNGARLISLSLICKKRTLLKRLSRDIRRGARKEDVKERAINYLPLYAGLSTAKVETDGLTPAEIAQIISDLC